MVFRCVIIVCSLPAITAARRVITQILQQATSVTGAAKQTVSWYVSSVSLLCGFAMGWTIVESDALDRFYWFTWVACIALALLAQVADLDMLLKPIVVVEQNENEPKVALEDELV